jgi:hypothetical protein
MNREGIWCVVVCGCFFAFFFVSSMIIPLSVGCLFVGRFIDPQRNVLQDLCQLCLAPCARDRPRAEEPRYHDGPHRETRAAASGCREDLRATPATRTLVRPSRKRDTAHRMRLRPTRQRCHPDRRRRAKFDPAKIGRPDELPRWPSRRDRRVRGRRSRIRRSVPRLSPPVRNYRYCAGYCGAPALIPLIVLPPNGWDCF